MNPNPQHTLPEDHAGRFAGRVTEFSLRRRITVLVLVLSIFVVGFIATRGIPLELFPRGFTSQSLMVWIPWQNAPTQEVLEKITLPAEEELSTVRGLDGMNSYTSVGYVRLFVHFKQGTDMSVAYREVRDRMQRARVLFPEDVDRVVVSKQDASGFPVFVIGLAIDPSLNDHYNLIKKEVLQRLERLDGVARVSADGLEEKEILIELDKKLAENNGLNIYQLAQQLGGDNFTLASGQVRDGGKKYLMRSLAQYQSLEELENSPLTATVRLKDVARIKYEEAEKRYRVRVNGRPAVAALVFKEGEANTVDVCKRIAAEFEEMRQNPRLSSVHMEVLFDQGKTVQEALNTLVEGGLWGWMLAGMVLFAFLRRLRLTTIITLSIPISILIALTVMFFAGESLNILTILGLVIAVGMLVDNSIVVAENIHRLHSSGMGRREACVKGAAEIALAITLATMTTIVVFGPIALVEGQGQFFLMRLALPITVALVASLLVALVFIPLSVYLTLPSNGNCGTKSGFRRALERCQGWIEAGSEATIGRVNRWYGRALEFFLGRRLDLVLILIAVFAATFFVPFKKVKLVEQQEEDRSSFRIGVHVPGEYSFEEVGEYFGRVEELVAARQKEFGLRGYLVVYHRGGGRVEGWLDPERAKELTAKTVGEKLVKELPRRPGIKHHFGQENQAREAKGREVFAFRLEGDDASILEEVATQLEPMLLSMDGVLGIRGGEDPLPSELALVVDRERLNSSEVSPEMVAGLVGYALRGSSLPKYNDAGREVPVRIRFQESDRESLEDLGGFQVPVGDQGALVPLSALTTPKVLNTPKRLFRWNKKVTRTLTVELKKETAKETRERLTALQRQLDLPEGVSFNQSRAQTEEEDIANMKFAAQLSIFFIYLLMGFLFESFILPLSIILTIPLAGIGVSWVHYLLGKDVDFLGLVGGILLIGVVVNNGIVLIDYVNRLRAEGMDRRDALLAAAARRFRPIAMTALTTILAMVPLAFSQPSEIGLSYKSFGLTLIGGMTTATVLTLLVVPVFYTFFDDARQAVSHALHRASRRSDAEAANGQSTEAVHNPSANS